MKSLLALALTAAAALPAMAQPARAPQWFDAPVISPQSARAAEASGGRVEVGPDGCERVITRNGLDGTAAPLGGYACRPTQVRFAEIVEEYRRRYRDAPNPIVASELRDARRRALCEAFPSGALQNWEGTLRAMDRKPSGHVALMISTRAGAIEISTSAADGGALAGQTQVAPGAPLLEQLRELRVGQRVHFSAQLMRGREDCFLTVTAPEPRNMTSPAFFARFTDVFPAR